MVQDVRTRWNSTIAMLQRAVRMRPVIREWVKTEPKFIDIYPTSDEWKQIEYVIAILHPFLKWTNLVSTSTGPTIHHAWRIYNGLFEHIEKLESALGNILRLSDTLCVLIVLTTMPYSLNTLCIR